ncbi:glycosyl hydrolase [Polaribacter sp. Hel1_85]|uniref:glycosyl hydrolase n=1 Tax=Polaribacter sp. Hel1_85 TaxID=1250005 RepID=UPI00052C288B|nr:glycosyl hydrolase [Polaribacter sp. Hel1_85]KGL58895.1 glycoside hydrolase family [Polaribacter sp. Hel1_85]
MKKLFYLMVIFFTINNFAQTNDCGTIINETFDGTGALPSNWTEYNTSGQVTLDSDRLKFDHNSTMPSAYTTFTPTSENSSFSFDVSATRTAVNCQVHLLSSTGEYISSVALGKGNATIKFATTMESDVPSGFIEGVPVVSFPSNTNFTISTQIDFTSKTVDFYIDGVLVKVDTPFLEDAGDAAKIDIQLIYMYSNSGQFYFDNISLFNVEENRLQLTSDVSLAEDLLSSASIGTIYNQYPQSEADAFQLVVDTANTVLSNCNASSTSIDSTIAQLQTAEETFEASRVNDPVLKMYNGSDLIGDEYQVYCGYYNGGLGAYEDWAVSFTLEKGYMATFAQDINGLGVSKIYIAQDDDLQINLPNDLQNSISFIRVSPWYSVGKKGALGNDVKWTEPEYYNTTWHYNWGLGLDKEKTEDLQFVPMAWSKADSWTSLQNMESAGENMNFNNLLAFNEPDNSDQSNLTVAEALEAYPKLLASGLRIGAPGVENIQYSSTNDSFNDGAWIQEFMDSCVVRGYRVDFIPAHDYIRRSKSSFIERFQALHDRYNLPVWVTEYNYGNPNMGSADLTVEQGYSNIKGLTEALEEADFIERYNWYYFFGSSTGIGGITDGELNITGEFYRDLVSQNPSYTQDVYEGEFEPVSQPNRFFIDHVATDVRLRTNDEDTDVLTSGTDVTGWKGFWDIIDAGNGYYYIQNVANGLKLQAMSTTVNDEASVRIINSSFTGNLVQWELIPIGDNWFIQNRQLNTRLNINGSQEVSVGPSSWNGTFVQWKLTSVNDDSSGFSTQSKSSTLKKVEIETLTTSRLLYPSLIDSSNPNFEPLTLLENRSNYTLNIYSLSGQLIFTTSNMEEAWVPSRKQKGIFIFHATYMNAQNIKSMERGKILVQ